MKIIFLDVDGVLNSHQSYIKNYRDWVLKGKPEEKGIGFRAVDRPDPVCMSNLKYILECCPDARIVISSSWRHGLLKPLAAHFRRHHIPWRGMVIGKTWRVRWSGGPRGEEIQAWLDKNGKKFNIEDFVIIDDSNDMGDLTKNHLYLTDANSGLQYPMAEDIVIRLGGRENIGKWWEKVGDPR